VPLPLDDWSTPKKPDAAPRLILGAMNFGKRTPEDEARRMVDRALEGGIPFIDTANAYVDGESERIVGRALRGRRDRAIVSTKVGLFRLGGRPDGLVRTGGRPEGLSRERILTACDESLGRLGTDYIDVYYLHVPSHETRIEESLAALAELHRAGKIRAWAVSNYASWQELEMISWCDREGAPRPIMAQQIYNLLVRQLDIEYFAFAAKYGLHTAVYNPLAGGLLTGRYAEGEPPPGSRFDGNTMYLRRYWSERLRREVADYRELASSLGMSLVALSYAWLASRKGVDSIVIGPGTVQHLEDALDAATLCLDEDVLKRIDDLHRVHRGTDAVYARIG
jgi:aryl-alcohol dehydrogenase-like predicted oxidoreductase